MNSLRKNNNIQNKVVTTLIFVLVTTSMSGAFLFSAKSTNAQALAVPTIESPLSPLNLRIYTPGVSEGSISAARAGVGATCGTILKALDAADKTETLIDVSSSSFLSIIGGGLGESAKLSKSIVKAVAAKECVDAYITALGSISSQTLTMGQDIQREQDKYTKISESLRKITEDLKARQNASVKDVLKAFMVKLVLNLNKNLTTKLVNSMVEKYKIDDYLAYGDAVATQVYSMKYINENFKGDARTQMMMRSLIQSDKIPQKAKIAQAFASTKAQDYLGSQCNGIGQLDVENMDSLKCLAAFGSEQSSSAFQFQTAQDQAQKIKSAGQQSAQAEVAQSNGFAPPRDCSGSLALQQQIDTKYETATNELVAAAGVLDQLQKAYKGKKTTKAELDKAQAAFNDIEKKYKDLPSQDAEPVIDICKAIDSPASFVGDQLNNFVKQHLDQGSQLKSDNLPFYANFLSDVASNFLGNLLTGGKSSSKIFKEAGFQAMNGAIGELASNLPKAQFNNNGAISEEGSVRGVVTINPRGPSSPEKFNPRGE